MDSYGDYILSTGTAIDPWERLFNRYFYESRFASYDTIVDLGPGRCAFTRRAPDKIVAIDSAPTVVEKFQSEGIDIRLGSAYEMPFTDGTVEAIYSCWLLGTSMIQQPR